MTTDIIMAENSLYIGGEWRRPTGDVIEVLDPSDERILARVGSATAAEVHEALATAHEAQRGWARTCAARKYNSGFELQCR